MAATLNDIVESSEAERLATGYVFTEGPLWHPDGYLLFVDIRRSQIFKLVPGGEPELIREQSGESNGMTFDAQGRVVICEMVNRRVTRMEADGSFTVLADRWDHKRLNRPNDVVGKSDGSLYFTNPGRERLDPSEVDMAFNSVHRITPDGTVDLVIPNVDYPNGLAFSPNERILYVANTRPGQYILAYDVHPDGTVSHGRRFADMSSVDATNGVPDGMKVDQEGRVYCTGPGGCWVFEPSGERIGVIRLPEYPANCAWGGPRSSDHVLHRKHLDLQLAHEDARHPDSARLTGGQLMHGGFHPEAEGKRFSYRLSSGFVPISIDSNSRPHRGCRCPIELGT